jgi:hypothetical protein
MALGVKLKSAPLAPSTDSVKLTDVSAAWPCWRAATGAAIPHMQGDQASICEALACGAGIAFGPSGMGNTIHTSSLRPSIGRILAFGRVLGKRLHHAFCGSKRPMALAEKSVSQTLSCVSTEIE